ncbi:MAG: hypothetical protein HYU67_04690 [Flavobacteriia bacterium]|nr:hypothetical protein [Flavobacteriia bacterium]
MNIFKRIKAKTPAKHKKIGRLFTVVGGACVFVAESGMIDTKPNLKLTLNIIGLLSGAKAFYHAQKVENGNID